MMEVQVEDCLGAFLMRPEVAAGDELAWIRAPEAEAEA